MTVKPVQNRGSGNKSDGRDDKETHQNAVTGVGAEPNSAGHGTSSRSSVAHGPLIHRNVARDNTGKAPQFDEIVRHRSSGGKSRPKRRDEHHNRTRNHNEERLVTLAEEDANDHCNSPIGAVTGAVPPAPYNITSNSSATNPAATIDAVSTEDLDELDPLGASSSVKLFSKDKMKENKDNFSGYNSGDEYAHTKNSNYTLKQWLERDEQFIKCMSNRGFIVRKVEEDGACLFRSISLQIYGDEDMHDVIRQNTMDYISKNREYFSHFVTEDIESYVARKRRNDSHGNHIEIQAMSEIYNRPVEVYCYEPKPINTFNSEQLRNGCAPLRLSYQHGSHYNAIIDPYNATVGVGLGLAGYKPEMQTDEAIRLSEQLEIEQTMFEDKLKTTDWEATNEAIEEQVARESYLQWCRENLQKSRSEKATATSTASSISSTITSGNGGNENINAENMGKENSVNQESKYESNEAILKIINETLMASDAVDDESIDEELVRRISVDHNSGDGNNFLHIEHIDDTKMNDNDKKGDVMDDSTNVEKAPININQCKRYRNVSPFCCKKQRRESKDNSFESLALEDDTSKDTGDPEKIPVTNDFDQQEPCTSKHVQTTKNQEKKDDVPVSSFYHELLEASYSNGGLHQMSESEMLQRAIQMSTNDYIEEQKRKYLFGE